MSRTRPENPNAVAEKLKVDWLKRLNELISDVNAWATGLGWKTRTIKKRMDDAEIGSYQAPALLLQQETLEIILEPIARTAIGAEGVVDLYLLPRYDDIASLYFEDGAWKLRYMFAEDADVPTIRDARPKTLNKKALSNVLEAMKTNAI